MRLLADVWDGGFGGLFVGWLLLVGRGCFVADGGVVAWSGDVVSQAEGDHGLDGPEGG